MHCLGRIDTKCQSSSWRNTTFYVVSVPGPAVIGLPTCENLKLVTINIDGVMTKPNEKIAMHATSSKKYPKVILKKSRRDHKRTFTSTMFKT